MTALSQDFLQSIGIQLDDATYQAFAEHFDETLYERIVESIIDNLSEEQLKSFVELQNSEEDIWPWIQSNVPELSEIVQDEIDILFGELAENSEQI